MKLMCVNNKKSLYFEVVKHDYVCHITIGKIYEEFTYGMSYDIWVEDTNYRVINDEGFGSWELIENFIPLEEWREQQLNKLNI